MYKMENTCAIVLKNNAIFILQTISSILLDFALIVFGMLKFLGFFSNILIYITVNLRTFLMIVKVEISIYYLNRVTFCWKFGFN